MPTCNPNRTPPGPAPTAPRAGRLPGRVDRPLATRLLRALPLPALCASVLLAAVPPAAAAADSTTGPLPSERTSDASRPVETEHAITVDGERLAYRAVAGAIEVPAPGGDGAPAARMFYIAYLVNRGEGEPARPLTFVFNGGPGSSAVWLHLGAFGPRRLAMDAEGHPEGPPYRLVDNPHTLLDSTDLVFVDPVGTGFSRTIDGADAAPFHEVHGDVESVGELIRRFVTRHERWGSPLFLAGESYGTIRAAGLADYLQRRFGLDLNGLVLVSPALDQRTFRLGAGNDLPYVLTLPAFAATAHYHGVVDHPEGVEALVEEAEELALGRYALALLQGASLPKAERRALAGEMARLTGLDADELARRDLRVPYTEFTQMLLEERELWVGLLDSRYTGRPNGMPAEAFGAAYDYPLYDPSDAPLDGAFASAFNRYVREELEVDDDRSYETLNLPVARAWNYGRVTNRYLYAADNLRAAMTMSPGMEVFMAAGRYDLVTTETATEYVVNHLGIEPELRDRLRIEVYPSGHMVYLHQLSLERLDDDLARFYERAVPGG